MVRSTAVRWRPVRSRGNTMNTPILKQCASPGCRAWSPEVAVGKPCPYCGATQFWTRANRILDWVVVVTCVVVISLHIWKWL